MEEKRSPDTQWFHNPGWGLKVQGGSFPPWLKPQITLIFSQAFPWKWNLAKYLVGTNTTSELELSVYLPGKTSILIPPQEHVLCKMVSRAYSFWMGSILSTAFQSTVFHFRLVCAPKFFFFASFHHKEEWRHRAIWMCSTSQQHRLIISRNKKNV